MGCSKKCTLRPKKYSCQKNKKKKKKNLEHEFNQVSASNKFIENMEDKRI